MVQPTYQQGQDTSERNWFQDTLTAQTPYKAPGPEYNRASGGIIRLANGGSVDYGTMPRYEFDPETQTFKLVNPITPVADVVDITPKGYTGYTGYDGGDAVGPAPSTNGSPTGSVMGDFGFAIANQSISPAVAAIAQSVKIGRAHV